MNLREARIDANAVVIALLAVVLALVPSLNVNQYVLHLGVISFLFVSMSSAWNILGGFAGQVSFGFAAFFGLGAYTTVILARAGLNPYLTIPIGAAIAVIFSVLVGYPTFRLRGPYFAIATIGVGEAVRVIMLNWGSVTGGASGLNMPTEAGAFVKEPHYFSALALMVAVLALCNWIMRSKFGLGLFAIKEDQDAAEALGVNSTWYKIYAHGVAAGIVAIAGSLYARYMFFIHPNGVFGFQMSISMLLMPVIGGVATLWGPVLGAAVYGIVQDQLMASYPELALLTYGVLLVLIIMFEPGGLMGLLGRLYRGLRGKRTRPAASKVAGAGVRVPPAGGGEV